MTKRKTFVLIDFENVQPKDIDLLAGSGFAVKIFLGPDQSKMRVDLVKKLQLLGENVDYITLKSAGKNALDFHIAYYMGLLSETAAGLYVISKDSGFDPLLKHLKEKGIMAHRFACLTDICSVLAPAKIDAVVKHLVQQRMVLPRKRKTLLNTIKVLFRGKGILDDRIDLVLSELCERGIVKLNGEKVSYNLPA